MRWNSFRLFLLAAVLLSDAGAAERDAKHVYTAVLSDPPVAARITPADKGADLRKLAAPVLAAQDLVRARLAASNIEVMGATQHVLNAVFIRATVDEARQAAATAGVSRVFRARRFQTWATEGRYGPRANAAGDVIRALEARQALGGPNQAGRGMRIGVIDSGVDLSHPSFRADGMQFPPGFPKGRPEDLPFTTAKVIAARSYVHLLNADDPAVSTPDDRTPRDRVGHGTAVAMLAAGRPVDSPAGELVGVAPAAYLGNYKIFGAPDINEFSNDAAVIAAMDDAVVDGMDILTVSFGAIAQFPWDANGFDCAADEGVLCDPVAQAAQNAVDNFGVVVVAAAGNAGAFGEQSFPTQNTISTPGTAPGVLTVGATVNSRRLLQSVRFGGRRIDALSGTGPEPETALEAVAVDTFALGDAQACSPLPGGSLTGRIAVIDRGGCEPEFKVEFADQAGAVGVVLVNTEGRDAPEVVLNLETTDIPTYTIGFSDGRNLIDRLASSSNVIVTLDPQLLEEPFASDQLAPFSSRGPSVGGGLKPEIVAPGAFLYAAAQRFDRNGDAFSPSGFETVDGTSFSAPLAAGAAALVWQANPGFTAEDVKSALVNTAALAVIEDGEDAPLTAVGGGLLDVAEAIGPIGSVAPAAVGFGDLRDNPLPLERTLQVTNTTSLPVEYTLRIVERTLGGARVSMGGVATARFLLEPGRTGSAVLRLDGNRPAAGQYEGFVEVSGSRDGLELLIPFYYAVGDGVASNAFAITGTGVVGTVNEPHPELLIFKALDRHGQPVPNLTTTFSVTAGGGAIFQADPATDAFGVAAADVDMGPDPGFQDYLAKAGGLEVPFFNEARLKPWISGAVNGAGFAAGRPVAPGSILSIFGEGIAEFTGQATTLPLPVALKHVSVSFDFPEDGVSEPGRLFFASPNQLNVQVPWELAGRNFCLMKVRIGDSVSEVFQLQLSDAAPGLFEFAADGRQLVIATHADGALVTAANPARAGETLILYGTGFGQVDVAQQTGVAAGASPVARTRQTPTVTVGGRTATVLFSGLTPDFVGLYQANITLPGDLPAGDHPILMNAAGADSNQSLLIVR